MKMLSPSPPQREAIYFLLPLPSAPSTTTICRINCLLDYDHVLFGSVGQLSRQVRWNSFPAGPRAGGQLEIQPFESLCVTSKSQSLNRN